MLKQRLQEVDLIRRCRTVGLSQDELTGCRQHQEKEDTVNHLKTTPNENMGLEMSMIGPLKKAIISI